MLTLVRIDLPYFPDNKFLSRMKHIAEILPAVATNYLKNYPKINYLWNGTHNN